MQHCMVERAKIVQSACRIEAVYMCFNRTDIWGGETTFMVRMFLIHSKFASNKPLKCRPYVYVLTISIAI